jgi:hypothetical protein
MRTLLVIRPYVLLLLAALSSLVLLYPPARSPQPHGFMWLLLLLVFCDFVAQLKQAGMLGMTPAQVQAAFDSERPKRPVGLLPGLLLNCVVGTLGTFATSAMN